MRSRTGEVIDERRSGVTPFKNVRVFDGRSAALTGPRDVVVRGKFIESIGPSVEPASRDATSRVIDGNRRVLMPGLIDAH
jgi:imidazolonepropionase-like amidohydrolase